MSSLISFQQICYQRESFRGRSLCLQLRTQADSDLEKTSGSFKDLDTGQSEGRAQAVSAISTLLWENADPISQMRHRKER